MKLFIHTWFLFFSHYSVLNNAVISRSEYSTNTSSLVGTITPALRSIHSRIIRIGEQQVMCIREGL